MDTVDLEEVGVNLKIDKKTFKIDNFEEYIGIENIVGDILDRNRKKRCTLKYYKKTVSGGYGLITFGARVSNGDIKTIVTKRLIKGDHNNLFREAILQHISYKTLAQYKLEYFIPKIHDIFYKLDTDIKKYILHFSMDEVLGTSIYTFLKSSITPEKDFLDCFIQISIALYLLQKDLNLDHRDLRYANIFIVKNPIEFPIKIGDTSINYKCNFHITILDFGFACIGHKPTILNAAEGFMHSEERCFKPGRDLFQLLISIWCKSEIRLMMNEKFIKLINSLLCYNNHDYSKIIETSSDSKWPYSLTADDNFSFIPLLPKNLLIKLLEVRDSWSKYE